VYRLIDHHLINMSNQIMSMAAWAFLPNLVTGWLQGFYYRATTRAGDPFPAPGSRRFIRDRRNIFILVIVSYLVYTIYEIDWDMRRKGNFYSDLGLSFGAEERTIQSKFRRLTVHIHPDKLKDPTPEQLANAQAYYIHIKNARDTLVDSTKRFAYERFGPDMLEWKKCITKFDFVKQGLQQLVPYYLVTYCTLIVAGLLGYAQDTRYWQYFVVTALFIFETHTVTRPTFPLLARHFFNPLLNLFARPGYLPFQTLAIVRRICVSLFIAAAQIAPQFRATAGPAADSPEAERQAFGQLLQVAAEIDGDAGRMLGQQFAPFKGDGEMEERVKGAVVSWLVQNEIRNERGVQTAIKRVVEKKNLEASGTSLD